MTTKSVKKYSLVTLGSLLAVGLLAGNCFALDSSRESQFPAGYYAQHVEPYIDAQYEGVTGVVTNSGPAKQAQGTFTREYMLENYYDQVYDDSNYDSPISSDVTAVVTNSGPAKQTQGSFTKEYILENYYDQVWDDSNYDFPGR